MVFYGQFNTAQLRVPGISQLREIGEVDVETLCYVTLNGWFYYDPASTAADNGYSVIQPTGVNPGRWLRTQDPEFASNAETATGTEDRKIITPAGLQSLLLGSPRYLFMTNVSDGPTSVAGGVWAPLSYNSFGVNQIGATIGNDNRDFTLPAGTFQIYALNTGSDCNRHALRVWSVTGATDLIYGSLGYAEVGDISTTKMFQGLTLGSETTIQIQYRLELAGNLGAVAPEGIDAYPQTQLLIAQFS